MMITTLGYGILCSEITLYDELSASYYRLLQTAMNYYRLLYTKLQTILWTIIDYIIDYYRLLQTIIDYYRLGKWKLESRVVPEQYIFIFKDRLILFETESHT